MLKQYKVVVAVLLVLALLVTFGCAPPPVEEEEKEGEGEGEIVVPEKTFLLGLLGALTGPLRAVAGGIYGMEDYFTYINEKGGIEYLDPKTGKTERVKFKWLMGDHAWDSAKCISLYERFKVGGAEFMVCNGSVPALSVYALMARDHIPGVLHVGFGEPCFYEIEEPYLLAAGCEPAPLAVGMYLAYFIKNLWDKPDKPKVGVMAADVGSRRVMDLPGTNFYEMIEAVGGELLPIEYVPIAPVDMKIQFSRLVEEGANCIFFDHWGEGAIRVFIHNAIDLRLWEKDVMLYGGWLDPNVSLAEPDVWNKYDEMGGTLLVEQGSFSGSQQEYDKWADNPQFWGLKLSFDLCKKYRDKLPEEYGGYYYQAGPANGILLEMVFKTTLEKYGYEGISGERLRETLFSLGTVDTEGLFPPFIVDYESLPCIPPWMTMGRIKDGHVIVDPDVHPFVEGPPIWGKTRFNPIELPPEWSKYVFTNYVEPMP